MKIHIASAQNSVVNHFIAQLRDVIVQKDSMRFRRNLERLGEVLAYEVSKTLRYRSYSSKSPLGMFDTALIADSLVLVTILRAGLPMFQGFLNVFEEAESGFIGAYRLESQEDEEVKISMNYFALPDLTDKIVILIDPMLATGKSLVGTYEQLLKRGTPKHVHFAVAIASKEGVEYVKNNVLTDKVSLWAGAVDEQLNAKAYIVPGLGDAGDLSFGVKIS